MPGSVHIRNVNGITAVVNLTTAADVTVDVFSDPALTEQVSLPATITTDTTFYTAGTGGYLLSVKVGGVEVAGPVELFLHGEGPVSFALDPDMSNTEVDTLLSVSSGGSSQWGGAANVQFSNAGDPNGVVTSDNIGDLCVDTATPALWQATAAADTTWNLIVPIVSQAGDPYGVVTPPAVGALYNDISNGALFVAKGLTNTDWVVVGGNAAAAPGVSTNSGDLSLTAAYTDGSQNSVTVGIASISGVQIEAASGQGVAVLSGFKYVLSGSDNGAVGLLGLYTATPVAQPAAIPAPAGGTTVDTEARAAITAILNAIGAAAGGIGITA